MAGSVRDLTTAIASGDTEAFAQFYRTWFDMTLTEARKCAGFKACDEQFCLDVVQDSMMRVIRHIKPFDSEIALRAWLCAVVRSCCLDQFRREVRRLKRERLAAKGEPVTQRQEISAQVDWLQKQLRSVGEDEVHLLNLRYRCGWTLQQIGRVLGLKPGAVDGRITRALAGLRRRAAEEFDD